MLAQICGVIVQIVHKMTSKFFCCKIWTSRGEIFALRNLQRDLHMLLDNIELRIENNNLNLEKTVWQLRSQIGHKMASSKHFF